MKTKTTFLLFLSLCSSLILTGCNIFENRNENSSSINNFEPYEYTTEDIKYYTNANEKICEFTSKNKVNIYTKAFDGYCAVALANIGDYYGPVLVGEDPIQVCFKLNNVVTEAGGSFIYDDKEYYYSKAENFIFGNLNETIKYDNYFSRYTTLEEVARDIVSKAVFEEIDPSIKNEFRYTEKPDGTYSISASAYSYGKEEIIIPSSYNGKKITSIDSNGFSGMKSLKSVRFADNSNITSIGKNAFNSCSSLKYVVIPDNIISIDSYAFNQCSEELMIYCEAESKPSGYYTNSYNDSDWYGSADKIWWGTYDYFVSENYIYGLKLNDTLIICKYLMEDEDVIILDEYNKYKVSEIGRYSFYNKTKIKSVNLPKSLLEIQQNAFNKCSQLEKIEIPAGVKKIGTYAFSECSSLKFAKIPDTVVTIDSYAFNKCSEELMIYCEAESKPNGYYTNSYNDSDWYGNADIVWWGMLDYIETDNYIFGVKIDETLSVSKYIGDEVNVIVPSGFDGKDVTSIGSYAFQGKNRVKTISLPDSLKKIASYSFNKCSQLEKIDIPKGTEYIGTYAFSECSSLKFAKIPDSVASIDSYAFNKCSEELMIYCEAESKPNGYYTNSYNDSDWYGNADIVWWGMLDYIETDNYIFGVKIDETLSVSKYIGSETDVLVPSSYNNIEITNIGKRAFQGKNKIKQIVLPNNITSIDSYSFDGCSLLEKVKLSNNLSFIGTRSFNNCYSLEYIIIPVSVITIESYTFYGCSSNLSIYCEVKSRPSGYYTNSYNDSDWYGNGKVYYGEDWEYDESGTPVIK